MKASRPHRAATGHPGPSSPISRCCACGSRTSSTRSLPTGTDGGGVTSLRRPSSNSWVPRSVKRSQRVSCFRHAITLQQATGAWQNATRNFDFSFQPIDPSAEHRSITPEGPRTRASWRVRQNVIFLRPSPASARRIWPSAVAIAAAQSGRVGSTTAPWPISHLLDTRLCLAALDAALDLRQPRAGLVHHSDRGVQYASRAYRSRLAAHGIRGSMSRRGNPYDNAHVESFFKTLKHEEIFANDYSTD